MDNLIEIATGLIFGIAIVAPFVVKAQAVSKELKEFFGAVEESLADKKITKEELLEIIEEAKEIVGAVK